MPIAATLTGPENTQTEDFNVNAVFGEGITSLPESVVDVLPREGNGDIGVTFIITGSGDSYVIEFTLPDDVEGAFTVQIIGNVTATGGVTPEVVMANTVTIYYNTQLITYRENSSGDLEIVVPIQFSENVLFLTKEHFDITKEYTTVGIVSDIIDDIEYYLLGMNRDYQLVFIPKIDRIGVVGIDLNKSIIKEFELLSTMEFATDFIPINFTYDTRIPKLVDWDILPIITEGIWDLYLEFDIESTGLIKDKLLQEGADLGDYVIYRWNGVSIPDYKKNSASYGNDRASIVDEFAFIDGDNPSFDTLLDEVGDWIKLTTTSGETPNIDEISYGNTVPTMFYMIRHINRQVHVDAGGIYNLTLLQDAVRGPHRF